MKNAGTLKIEIKCPADPEAQNVFQRMHALRRTVAQALNLTMQDLHGGAVGELRAIWDGEGKKERAEAQLWRERSPVLTRLGRNWNAILLRERTERVKDIAAAQIYAPINGSALAEETRDNILARFHGEHLKDLIALRASFPSFGDSSSFYCGARFCEISGSPDEARIKLPLWGTGSKLTEFVIDPAGGSHRAFWRKMVADFSRRQEIVDAEARLDKIHRNDTERAAIEKLRAKKKGEKDKARRAIIDGQIKAVIDASNKRVQSAKDPIERKLYGMTKMGRIGINYNERRRKWFVTISFTEYVPDVKTKGQKAALNFGINKFVQVLAEDGSEFHESGEQIIEKRQAFGSIRRRIQESTRTFGSGSKGRGVKRRELPNRKREGDETNFIQTYIRQLASTIITWCVGHGSIKGHGVSDLYIEDMTGIREQFERDTAEQAHEEVKRRIHSWPFYETGLAIAREGQQRGVRVEIKGAHFVSQRCPSCRHTTAENITRIERAYGNTVTIDAGRMVGRKMKEVTEAWTAFKCVKCGLKRDGDIIACANHLLDVGATHVLEKQQQKSRKENQNGSSNRSEQVHRGRGGNSRGAKSVEGGGRAAVLTPP